MTEKPVAWEEGGECVFSLTELSLHSQIAFRIWFDTSHGREILGSIMESRAQSTLFIFSNEPLCRDPDKLPLS